jgi:hypothetical protein
MLSKRSIPKATLDRLGKDHLPVDDALKYVTDGLDPIDLPESVSALFGLSSRQLPSLAAGVFAGAEFPEMDGAFPSTGVIGSLQAWLGEDAIGTQECDDADLGNMQFSDRLASLMREIPSTGVSRYSTYLANNLLRATVELTRPCPRVKPSVTAFLGEYSSVAPPGGGSFVGATGLDVTEGGSILVADAGAKLIARYGSAGDLELAIGIDDQGQSTGIFQQPTNVYGGDNGDIYVSDFAANRVFRFRVNGHLLNELGSGPGSAPGEFNRPTGIAATPDGNIIVADAGNARLQLFSPDGKFQRLINGPPEGSPGHLSAPRGLDVNASGIVAVVDRSSATIVLIRLADGAYIGSSAPNSGTYTQAPTGLWSPIDVDFDSTGNIWVADWLGLQLMEFSPGLTIVRNIQTLGFDPSTAPDPVGVDVDHDSIYILHDTQQQVLRLASLESPSVADRAIGGGPARGSVRTNSTRAALPRYKVSASVNLSYR